MSWLGAPKPRSLSITKMATRPNGCKKAIPGLLWHSAGRRGAERQFSSPSGRRDHRTPRRAGEYAAEDWLQMSMSRHGRRFPPRPTSAAEPIVKTRTVSSRRPSTRIPLLLFFSLPPSVCHVFFNASETLSLLLV